MPKIFITPCPKTKPLALSEQISLAKQLRLKFQNALAQQRFHENSSFKLSPGTTMPLSNILEDISQNISKMDQNLYSTKANMEDILRANSPENEFVSLN